MVNFAAGGVATPADAALMMQMGMDGVFVGSGIFKSGDPAKRARAIVQVRAAAAAGACSLSALTDMERHTLAVCVGLPVSSCLKSCFGCVQAVTHYQDPKVLAEVSTGLGEAMVGIDCRASNFYSYAARSE